MQNPPFLSNYSINYRPSPQNLHNVFVIQNIFPIFANKSSLLTEALRLNEHEAAKWLAKDELDSVKWQPADVDVIARVLREIL